MHTSSTMLATMYLGSPSLPTGAFAYSQGLESAIDRKLVRDRETLKSWCRDALSFGLAELDAVLLLKLFEAIVSDDLNAFEGANDALLAARETHELLQEELHLGKSLSRLIKAQSEHFELGEKSSFLEISRLSFVAAFAISSYGLSLDREACLTAFLWSWLDNQVAVSCKAVPLGQTDAQDVLLSLRPTLMDIIARTQTSQTITGSLPGVALLSALHEEQYSRLFRS